MYYQAAEMGSSGAEKARMTERVGVNHSLHLVLQILREALSLVQGKPRNQFSSQDMSAAQLVDHLRHVEERIVLQQLPTSDVGRNEHV